MKSSQIIFVILVFVALRSFSQNEKPAAPEKKNSRLSIEPGLGISPLPIVDMSLSNIIQLGITKRMSLIAYTSWKENNLFLRKFNYIESTNNHTFTQKFGMGTSRYTKRSIHTLSMLMGLKYESYRETLNNPEFEKVSVSSATWSPDLGLMYNLKLGRKKYFLSYRMYIPLYPYPAKTVDLNAVDGNLADVSLELGVGIRLNQH